ncbi:MAG: hypothetical protein JSV17_04745 [Candidatus Aminicenantes bacterium]|nr:MAG: hypothetical protein JSV17_04745 [Candidatus Aminicenantes bacterium]
MFQTAVRILKATIGIRSNQEELLLFLPFGVEVESLLTDFRRVEQIAYTEGLDGYISVEDAERNLTYECHDKGVIFKGPFSRLQKEASDPRHTLWGNQGFLYRYALYLLEKKHNIYNFHACALYQEERDRLFVIIGGAGSGKTVYLLSGLEKGLKLFSTETVHFRIEGSDIIWYMGSLVDNVRYGTLMHDFPRFLPSGDVPDIQNMWQKKIAIDLSAFCIQKETIKNPRAVHILFPRIEKGFERPVWNPVKDKRKAIKILFDNITQKVAETTLLYDKLTVLGLDETDLANARLLFLKELVSHQTVTEIGSVLSGPKHCWENVLK